MPKAMSVTQGKPGAVGRQRKETFTGRVHKVSNQETRQKPKVSALKMPYRELFPKFLRGLVSPRACCIILQTCLGM